MIAHLTPNSFVRSSRPPNTEESSLTRNSFHRTETETTGSYSISGTVKELGVTGAYRVRLFENQSARCIRETWSAGNGAYSFENLADLTYFVVAYDHGATPQNAAISDSVKPSTGVAIHFNLGATTGVYVPKIFYGAVPIVGVPQ